MPAWQNDTPALPTPEGPYFGGPRGGTRKRALKALFFSKMTPNTQFLHELGVAEGKKSVFDIEGFWVPGDRLKWVF